jgi:hypothetical protein
MNNKRKRKKNLKKKVVEKGALGGRGNGESLKRLN